MFFEVLPWGFDGFLRKLEKNEGGQNGYVNLFLETEGVIGHFSVGCFGGSSFMLERARRLPSLWAQSHLGQWIRPHCKGGIAAWQIAESVKSTHFWLNQLMCFVLVKYFGDMGVW